MIATTESLLAEIDAILSQLSPSQCVEILRRLTSLFVDNAATYSDEHVAVFDEVMGRFVARVERPALIELSNRLAAVGNAPAGIVDRLARHEDIAVSGPVLQGSPAVSDQALAAVARDKGDKHLAAIAARAHIAAIVTDVLLDRCNTETVSKLIANQDASVSELGFVKLITRAKGDKALAAMITGRADLPAELKPFAQLALGR